MRDNFTAKTKRALAIRAAHFCSNPNCLKLTAGPRTDEAKALTSGHAAHVHAASPGGPRYDPTQTTAERKYIGNAIWLCRECGDLVDKDRERYGAATLRRWKKMHESMISEVRTKGYAASLALLQSRQMEPAIAKKILAVFEDKRVLWVAFDQELPDRVRVSLDALRSRLAEMRGALPDGSKLDQVLLSLTKTVHIFFNAIEYSDLAKLRCDSRDPAWCKFRDALASLRKSIGLQVANLVDAYQLQISPDLISILPKPPLAVP
jgi:hypothetical protein